MRSGLSSARISSIFLLIRDGVNEGSKCNNIPQHGTVSKRRPDSTEHVIVLDIGIMCSQDEICSSRKLLGTLREFLVTEAAEHFTYSELSYLLSLIVNSAAQMNPAIVPSCITLFKTYLSMITN